MKYLSLIVLFILMSCGNKEDILLPKSDKTIVSNIEDHSPIYIFFRTNDKDTLTEVNRKNSIITTNWIFNIDKRLPLRIVIPQVMKLQDKKRKEKAHKNEKAENYYSYADSIGKNMAFIPFTKVYYKLEKPSGTSIFFNKKNEILVNNVIVKQEELEGYLENKADKSTLYQLCFDKEMSFDSYLKNIIFLHSIKLETNENFIF
jgi:predicted small lipoprotein YifL